MILKVKKLRPDAISPRFAHPDDSGMDVCAAEDALLPPGGRALVPTGLAFEPPPGTELQARPRSGLAVRSGLTLLNTPATIDEGYRGEVAILLVNLGDVPVAVKKGDRIAQLVLCPVLRPEIALCDELSETGRGAGGFGSSGIRWNGGGK